MRIRPERPDDIAAVRRINEAAFGQPLEAGLVDRLRAACADALSLVADDEGGVIGHILFTPVVIDDGNRELTGMGLAPMAVRPDRQGQGIGSALVRHGLTLLEDRACPFVVVVGHPTFYPRFGFVPASRLAITSQWDGIPDEAFMIRVLRDEVMGHAGGVARYRDEFNED